MKTIVSDVSRVTLFRTRLGHAASSMKVIGVVSAFLVIVKINSDFIGLGLALGIFTLWFAFRLSKHLRLGETYAAILIILWVVGFSTWTLIDPGSEGLIPKKMSFNWVIGILTFYLPIYFIIRGLLELRAYKTNPNEMESFTLHPWEDRGKIERKHPKFLNKKSFMAYVFILLCILPVLFLWAAHIMQPPDTSLGISESYDIGYKIGNFLFALPFWWMAITLYRRARRHAMLPGNKLLKKDNRDVILYLRAFLDDSTIKMRARNNDGRIFLERFVKITFEELVTDHLWRYGPVVAIGDPHTKSKLVPLGAARDFVPNAENDPWKQKVVDLMQQASIIVAVVNQSPGFIWEMNTIIKDKKLKSKLVLLLPPLKAQDLRSRWDTLVSEVTGAKFPQDIDLTNARAMLFLKDQAVVITADKRNDWTYETVLDKAAELILGNEVVEGDGVGVVAVASIA